MQYKISKFSIRTSMLKIKARCKYSASTRKAVLIPDSLLLILKTIWSLLSNVQPIGFVIRDLFYKLRELCELF